MYPLPVTSEELFRFQRLIGQKGVDVIDWNTWKFSYRKNMFTALLENLRFFGFIDEESKLTSLGKRFIFAKDNEALTIGIVQSDYFSLLKKTVR